MAGSHGPLWTSSGADRRASMHGGMLTGVGSPTTPGHGSSLTGVENGGRSMGVPF
jgi:hypothetical protein